MSMSKLAWQNFQKGIKNYLSLILSLAFTILIFMNFQNIVYSDALSVMGEHNKQYSEIIVQTISVVLGAFMFFFTAYATNVFLTRRKKEIGIYVFMGLTNQKIGKLYAIEMTFVGVLTLLIGIGLGILTTQLFQMLLLAMSDITVEIGFHLSLKPVLITIVFYLIIYMFFVVKGYRNIVKSSVLSLVSANRQNEYVKQSSVILLFNTLLGVAVLAAGYYMAIKEGGQEVMGNVLAAVVLVIIGVYLLFGGFVPMVFQKLAKRKTFLYHRERNLWMNQVIFRMKKNYRTYAMVCVLMLCSVTALATGFAIKSRYKNMVRFRNVYMYQLVSNRADLDKKAQAVINKYHQIAYHTKISMLTVTDQMEDVKQKTGIEQTENVYTVLSWSQVQQLAKDAGLLLPVKKPNSSQMVKARHIYMLSLLTKQSKISKQICGKEYEQILDVDEPYLGYLQESMDFYIVDDTEYDRMRPFGQELYLYSYQITDTANYKASVKAVRKLACNTKENNTACIVTTPDSVEKDIGWVKILYSLCTFVVMVFLLASGSILFMKLYNDAFEEQERYQTLQKIGCSYHALKRSVSCELFITYALPFIVMMVSSYFSVHALEKMMHEDLTAIRFASIGINFVIFFFCYCISVGVYLKNAMIDSGKK